MLACMVPASAIGDDSIVMKLQALEAQNKILMGMLQVQQEQISELRSRLAESEERDADIAAKVEEMGSDKPTVTGSINRSVSNVGSRVHI